MTPSAGGSGDRLIEHHSFAGLTMRFRSGATLSRVRGRVIDIDRHDLDRWCLAHLGSGVEREVFRRGHLSTVIGVELSSRATVVVKIRPPSDRLATCEAVRRILSERGFPCPEPFTGLEPFGEQVASAEGMVGRGDVFPAGGRAPEPFAAALGRLVALAPEASGVGTLDPPPPWTGPDRRADNLWPWPDDRDVDLNAIDGPSWIDAAGRAARDRLVRSTATPVIGHGDWHTANLRWADDGLLAAFDWDSVIAAPEPVLAGLAAAVFPTTHAGTEATVDESAEFLAAYQEARARALSGDDLELAWAAGLWNRTFDAKKQFATEGEPRSLTESEARERCQRAGVALQAGPARGANW